MQEIQLTDWSTAGNLSIRSSGVRIPRDICTRFGCNLYSTKCSWIIKIIIIITTTRTTMTIMIIISITSFKSQFILAEHECSTNWGD